MEEVDTAAMLRDTRRRTAVGSACRREPGAARPSRAAVAPQAAGYVGPPCEWPCCRGSTHRWSSAASRPTRTAWPRALARAGHDVVVLTLHHPDAPEDSVVDGVRVVRARAELPWLPDDHFVAHMAGANHHLVAAAARLGRLAARRRARPRLAGGLGRQHAARELGRTPRRHDPRHGARPRRRPPVAGPVDGHQQRRVVAHVRGHAGHLLLQLHARRGGRRVPAAGRQGRRGAQRRRPGRLGPGTGRRPPRAATSRSSSRGDGSSTRRASRRWSTPCPRCAWPCPASGRSSPGGAPTSPICGPRPRRPGWPTSATSPASSPTTSCKHLLHEATVAVIPSFYEPFGIVALEAMAAGAPVIAAASGGLIEVIDGTGAGLLYPPGDTGALSGTLRRVLAQPRRAGRPAGDGVRPARAALHVGQGGGGHRAGLRDGHRPRRLTTAPTRRAALAP